LAEIAGVDDFRKRLNAITDHRTRLGNVGLRAVAYSKALVPRRTGNLGRTIRLGKVTETSVEVVAGGKLNVGYARPVELGSRPHIIRPRKARVLAWGGSRTLGGRLRSGQKPTHFAMSVRHPGTRAHPYLIPGIKRAVSDAGFLADIVADWNRAA
jgi:hypothetical protein